MFIPYSTEMVYYINSDLSYTTDSIYLYSSNNSNHSDDMFANFDCSEFNLSQISLSQSFDYFTSHSSGNINEDGFRSYNGYSVVLGFTYYNTNYMLYNHSFTSNTVLSNQLYAIRPYSVTCYNGDHIYYFTSSDLEYFGTTYYLLCEDSYTDDCLVFDRVPSSYIGDSVPDPFTGKNMGSNGGNTFTPDNSGGSANYDFVDGTYTVFNGNEFMVFSSDFASNQRASFYFDVFYPRFLTCSFYGSDQTYYCTYSGSDSDTLGKPYLFLGLKKSDGTVVYYDSQVTIGYRIVLSNFSTVAGGFEMTNQFDNLLLYCIYPVSYEAYSSSGGKLTFDLSNYVSNPNYPSYSESQFCYYVVYKQDNTVSYNIKWTFMRATSSMIPSDIISPFLNVSVDYSDIYGVYQLGSTVGSFIDVLSEVSHKFLTYSSSFISLLARSISSFISSLGSITSFFT
jgi:hypothetical protein